MNTNLGHRFKKIKFYRYGAVMKFGELEKTELYNVYVFKFYPSGFISERGTYDHYGQGLPSYHSESERITCEDGGYGFHYYSEVELKSKFSGKFLNGSVSIEFLKCKLDEKGNWIMFGFSEKESGDPLSYMLYIREIEYYD